MLGQLPPFPRSVQFYLKTMEHAIVVAVALTAERDGLGGSCSIDHQRSIGKHHS